MLGDEQKFSRADRVAGAIKREVSNILQNKIKETESGFITVSRVGMSKDLRIANIHVSIFGNPQEQKKAIDRLNANETKYYIRGLIGKKIVLKYLPDIKFFLDESLDYTEHMTKVIKEIKNADRLKINTGFNFTEDEAEICRKINEKILSSEKILLTSHAKIDGDAFGSVMAMNNYLTEIGKKTIVAFDGGCPNYLQWLPDSGLIEENKIVLTDKKFDLIICIDSNYDKRSGFPYEMLKDGIDNENIIIIDHHQETEKSEVPLKLVRSEASSSGELMYNFFRACNIELNNKTALYLYIAIVTDTWLFSQENTSASVMAVAAELLKFESVKPYSITSKIFENKSINQIKLLGKMIETIELDEKYKISSAYISSAMFKETATSDSDTEGFVNTVRSVRNSRIAILIKEFSPGKIKVNMRSKDEYNLLPVAMKFGGGGHKKACGFESFKTIEVTKNDLLQELRSRIDAQ